MRSTADTPSSEIPRVVITGMGIVSPLGRDVTTFWERLNAAEAPAPTAFSPETVLPADFSGTVADFGELPPPIRKQLAKSLKVMNRETQLGVAAAWQALQQSAVLEAYPRERMGITFGAENVRIAPEDFDAGVANCLDESGNVDLNRWGTHGIAEVAPLWMLRCLPNMPACHLAILADLRGPNNTITQTELGMDLAIAEACRIIRRGDADLMVVGGVGTHVATMNQLRDHWRERDTDSDSDPRRIPSEGAGAIVIEEYEAARQRGATILGEILAAVSTSGTNQAGSPRRPPALDRALTLALRNSQLSVDQIGHLNLPQATLPTPASTPASPFAQTPIFSVRHRLGHAGAGSSAMELVASLLALGQGASPELPTPGENFLKISYHGRKRSSCVAIARLMPESAS